jgi:hypothetical protein
MVLYVGTPGDFHKIRQSGDPAPDCPGYYLHAPSARFSPHGILWVNDYLQPDYNWQVMWIGPPSDLQLAYRAGMQAPGCPAGVFFTDVMCELHNDAGQIGFAGTVYGPGVVYLVNDRGHWQGTPGALQKVSRMGDPAADMPDGVTYRVAGGGAVALNAAGQTAEMATIQGPGVTDLNDKVLYAGDSAGLHVSVREGDPAPPDVGAGVTEAPVSFVLLNDLGEQLCEVRYSGPGITEENAYAVEFGPPCARCVVMRGAGPAPGFSKGISLAGVYGFAHHAAMNHVGDIVGATEIAGPDVTADNKVVLWMWHHVLRRWTPLLRSGSELDGRTIYAEDVGDFGCGGTGGGDGYYQCFNDSGMVGFWLQFTDGTDGIYRISPPVFADADGDRDVDAIDLRLAQSCFIGVENQTSEACAAVFDLDQDGDVDVADMAMMQQLVGP